MSDFSIRADSVNVEEIMRRVRARIREKRGVDYTEEEIQELAAVKLEKFLDPQKVRSELLQHFQRTATAPPNFAFEDTTLFESHRGIVRVIRRLLGPILKLFFNPNPLVHALHIQSQLNTRNAQHADLSYELMHNLVVELTRVSIEVKNLKMRVESLSSRLDFDERRARALEGAVQYRPGAVPAEPPSAPEPPVRDEEGEAGAAGATGAAPGRSRRRRRRRGRRGGGGEPVPAGPQAPAETGSMVERAAPSDQAPADTSAAEPAAAGARTGEPGPARAAEGAEGPDEESGPFNQ
jgi:hypothetical protein